MNSRRPVNSDVGHLVRDTQQIRAITLLTSLGAALLSIALPVLVVMSDVGPDFVVGIFAPGLLLMSPVHNAPSGAHCHGCS